MLHLRYPLLLCASIAILPAAFLSAAVAQPGMRDLTGPDGKLRVGPDGRPFQVRCLPNEELHPGGWCSYDPTKREAIYRGDKLIDGHWRHADGTVTFQTGCQPGEQTLQNPLRCVYRADIARCNPGAQLQTDGTCVYDPTKLNGRTSCFPNSITLQNPLRCADPPREAYVLYMPIPEPNHHPELWPSVDQLKSALFDRQPLEGWTNERMTMLDTIHIERCVGSEGRTANMGFEWRDNDFMCWFSDGTEEQHALVFRRDDGTWQMALPPWH